MAVVGQPCSLSTLELDLLWERLALGAFPLVLQLRPHGDTFAERHALLDGARAQLQDRGLVHGTHVEPRLEGWLHALARPDEELDVRWRDGEKEVRALVVRQDECTVRAVRRDDEVVLTPITPGSMVAAAVEVLPTVAAAATGQVSGPTDQLSAAYETSARSADAGVQAMLALGAAHADATAVAAALAKAVGVAQLGAACTTRGRRWRHPSVVAVLDTEVGRYTSTERAAPDHRMWSTIRPASPAHLVRATAALLGEAQAVATQSTGSALRL
ncbi:ESX secretion-associated protein EspG [Rhodococcus sp. X156]|uniref:ESX secretion-associated protein EspG n=1 Tax=Rhodococcus sp. X156 TaxID=2499145 RepID=UPI0013E3CC1D|nr:ESX secretion-associated protein EspG [Rhodococcus sp. X156]